MSNVWKRLRISVALMVLCSFVVGLASAEETGIQALPGTGWQTGIQIQNVGTGNALIELTGYARNSGTASASVQQSAVPGASVNLSYPAAGGAFDGSGVVSSDQPVVAIVNVNNASVSGFAAGQYQGTGGEQVATTLRFPLAKNNLSAKCTTFYVQNASSSPANITATFSNNPASVTTFTNVPANTSVLIDPAAATPALPGTAPFALTVTANQPIAGTVLEHFCTTAETLQATRGFTPGDSDTVVFAPIFKQAFNGRTNGLQVQNVHTAAADISVVFTCATGCSGSFTHTAVNVPVGASATFFNNAVLGGSGAPVKSGNLPNGALASARITATPTGGGAATAVIAINNESYVSPLPAGILRNTQTTYSALPASVASSKVGIPLVKEEFANKTTGIQIQNTSATPVTVRVVYAMTAPAGASCLKTATLSNINIAANSSVTLFRPNLTVPAGATWGASGPIVKGCFGGAVVEVTSGTGSVVAVVQEPDINPNAALRQDTKNYEGFKIQ